MKRFLLSSVFLICALACKQSPFPPAACKGEAQTIMDEVRQRNRAYIQLTERDDTLMQRVVAYYEKHGTSNELMEAYYLMGSVYRDLHEAPKAMEAFLNGISAADTTNEDCRYDILARLYGQKYDLLRKQNLYKQAEETGRKVYEYAILAKDTLFLVATRWKQVGLLFANSDYQSVAEECWNVLEESKRLDMYAYGASWLCTGIIANVEIGQVEDAAKLLSIYEQHSGCVDTATHECSFPIYYYAKGRVLAALGKSDSAEYFYRKELTEEADWNNRQAAYRGLRMLFEQKGQMDSVCKYAPLQCDAVDSSYQEMLSKNLQDLNEMYDYTRLQRDNDHKEMLLLESRRKSLYVGCAFAFIIVFILFIHLYHRSLYRQRIAKTELKLERAGIVLEEQEKNLAALREELKTQTDEKERLRLAKEVEFSERETEGHRRAVMNSQEELDQLRLRARVKSKTFRQQFSQTVLFQSLLYKARHNAIATEKDYESVQQALSQSDAELQNRFYMQCPHHTETELHCFLLLRFGMTKTEVGILTAHSQAAITNLCVRLFQKMSGRKGVTSAEAYEWMLKL